MSSSAGPRLYKCAAHAKLYRMFRPTYPSSVVDKILSFLSEKLLPPFDVAVDVGCGTGQSTRFLAPHFRKVVGVDPSDAQLQEAWAITKEQNVVYRNGSAEEIPAEDRSVDLVTTAQSLHWFNAEKFFTECNRVLKPQGCVAAYGYGIMLPCMSNKEVQSLMQKEYMQMYNEILGPYLDERSKLAHNCFRDITIPYTDSRRDTTLVMKSTVHIDDLIGYIKSWSSYQKYYRKYPDKIDFLSEYRKRFLNILQPLSQSSQPEKIEFDLVAPIFIILGRNVDSTL
ncbi:putative S-adenosylmethionine-dependent methyltransferase CRG1 [Holothuria leucospilota]|uniref:S-adenosylmethionine-dependent methyltransferase CRG1 n=1 Tax=Holothuria leucospilota TaxID=206669 RepID=A0A9Q1CHY4_HOLLE|nr:putative S-adenosylmethionine-dependent methyltransferase CRG1 [Holothuria leucospilota]